MNLTNLRADLYRRLGFASAPGTDVQTRLTAYLNEVQQDLLSLSGMEVLLRDTVTFASVASTQAYALPNVTARIIQLYDTTNDRVLDPLSESMYRAMYPDPSAITGTPVWWVPLGHGAVRVQPSNASQIWVDSTNAGDTGTAYLEGYRTGGVPFSVSVTMTGTTAVAFSPTDIIHITKFYTSAVAVGRITLLEDSDAGTELAALEAGYASIEVPWIALAPTPAAAVTYTLTFQRDVTDMSNGTDSPVLPERFHRLLLVGARMMEYERRDATASWTAARAEYARGVKDLKYWLYSTAVGSPNLRYGRTAIDTQRQRLTAW